MRLRTTFTNAVTTAAKARPMMKATASSTRLPRVTNFLNSSSIDLTPLLRGRWATCSRLTGWFARHATKETFARSSSVVIEGDHLDRGDVRGRLRRAWSPEEGKDSVGRDQIDRVRVEQARLERVRIDTGRTCPSSVGDLDPATMNVAQRVEAPPERVDGRRCPRSRLEPGAHRAHESQPRGIGRSSSPAAFVLDHRSPQRDGAADARRRPRGSRALRGLQGPARVDAATTVDVRRVVPAPAELQDGWNA